MSERKAIECIRAHKRFLITTHTNMEGDALGSELALYHLLRKLKKNAVLVNDDVIPYGYEFLPFVRVIKRFRKGMSVAPFDCFVALDCSDLRRPGEVHTVNRAGKPILNIDHHISNSYFGTVNWVDPHACCCCELIWRLYKHFRIPLDPVSAVLLYTGIVTDTGSFRYSNTNATTHRIVAELVRHGVDVSGVYRNIYDTIPYPDLELLIKILPTMRVAFGGKLAYFEIPKKLIAGHPKICFDLSDHVLSFGRSMKGVEVVVLFKENLSRDNEVRVNFRSHGTVDVNAIARSFGGGGHPTASGATIQGSLAAVEKKVLYKIKTAFS